MAGKYFDINTNLYRTLLIDPTDGDKKNYDALLALHLNIISSLKIG